ncbi:hypothetical protein F5B22DRAFT_239531 [Xylaria bambusicola]|uniref:uncharacterized protein n=1 Tax=Xylaria bambusicola TaxID=326684 RepID=UPI00200814BD|nr:uncharacterized protein F5B22DRAFT_239531 [Xylaria bambusicola]KAI0514405.1 hypothetical protein F5B22DRAFT_239531 [Xylaria bambusicola]
MEYRTKEPENQSMPQRFGRWLSLKQYQIEVTFGVYMFTPTEKFIFWSIVFLLSAMGSIATILYLPQHIVFIINRAWFYVNGGEGSGGLGSPSVVAAAKSALSLSLDNTDSVTSTATEIVREL